MYVRLSIHVHARSQRAAGGQPTSSSIDIRCTSAADECRDRDRDTHTVTHCHTHPHISHCTASTVCLTVASLWLHLSVRPSVCPSVCSFVGYRVQPRDTHRRTFDDDDRMVENGRPIDGAVAGKLRQTPPRRPPLWLRVPCLVTTPRRRTARSTEYLFLARLISSSSLRASPPMHMSLSECPAKSQYDGLCPLSWNASPALGPSPHPLRISSLHSLTHSSTSSSLAPLHSTPLPHRLRRRSPATLLATTHPRDRQPRDSLFLALFQATRRHTTARDDRPLANALLLRRAPPPTHTHFPHLRLRHRLRRLLLLLLLGR